MVQASRPYHHGALKEALVEAAVALIEEGGIEAVSVREAAKRVGVSPGAPFRHFASKTALMTAVAEEAMARFKAEVLAAMTEVAAELAQLNEAGVAKKSIRVLRSAYSVCGPAAPKRY